MTINMKIWRVQDDGELKDIKVATIGSEERLENWIAKDSSILGLELLIIGRQVTTQFGGRIDLLGIDRQGDVSIIELKRDKTPREVVAQIS